MVNSLERDKLKAKHTRNQQKIFDQMLKLRIKEQRSLTISNRLPQGEMLRSFQEHDPEIQRLSSSISSHLQDLIGSLLLVGYELRSQHNQLSQTVPDDIERLLSANSDGSKQSRKRKRSHFTPTEEDDSVSFYWSMIDEFHQTPSWVCVY